MEAKDAEDLAKPAPTGGQWAALPVEWTSPTSVMPSAIVKALGHATIYAHPVLSCSTMVVRRDGLGVDLTLSAQDLLALGRACLTAAAVLGMAEPDAPVAVPPLVAAIESDAA